MTGVGLDSALHNETSETAMKLLVNADLIDVDGALLDQVRAVSGGLEVVVTTDAGRIEQVIPEVEVILGGIGPDLLPKAPNLRWVQSPAAGVDGALYPGFAGSDVILTSAKGFVGVHLADHAMALETSLVFLAGYLAMTLTAFAVITELTPADRASDVELVDDYRGLFWRRPVLASMFTVALLSLAGIPLTAGFIAKFYLFAAGVEGALWTLIWAMIVGSAISIYYYLKIVFAMTAPDDDKAHRPASWVGTATTVALALLVIALGTYPTPLIDLVRMLVDGVG